MRTNLDIITLRVVLVSAMAANAQLTDQHSISAHNPRTRADRGSSSAIVLHLEEKAERHRRDYFEDGGTTRYLGNFWRTGETHTTTHTTTAAPPYDPCLLNPNLPQCG